MVLIDFYSDINLLTALVEVILPWGFLIFVFLAFKLSIYFYRVATTPSGIHYVNQERQQVSVKNIIVNPFYFEVDDTRTNSSGVTCIMKCDRRCYILPLWRVPIFALFKFLNEDWSVLLKSNANIAELKQNIDKLVSKCAHSEEPFFLNKDEEKIIELKTPEEEMISEDVNLRKSYPLVVLILLDQEDDLKEIPDSFVIGIANVVHVPDNVLNKTQLIGQFVKLASGHLGRKKKVFFSGVGGQMNGFCLICDQRVVSVVQLGCLHACVCQQCYDRCDKCPLCRNGNMDFFVLPNSTNFSAET